MKVITKKDEFYSLGELILGEANNRPTIYNDSINNGTEPYWYRDIGSLERTRGLGGHKEREQIKPVLQIALDNKYYFQKALRYISDKATLYIYGNRRSSFSSDKGKMCYEDTSDYELLRLWYKYNYHIEVSPKMMVEIVKIMIKYGVIPSQTCDQFDADRVMEILTTN